jgi:hypothetical protein
LLVDLERGHETDATALEVRLARAATVEVTVTGAAGAPVEGARVRRPGSELIQNGEHRVEVVIADGEFAGSTTELLPRSPRILPDGGTIEDQSYIDTYLWIVKTSDTLTACQ